MTRIATAAENSQMVFFLQQNQSQLNTLSTQISSGVTAQTYAGIAPQAETLTNARSDVAQQQDFNTTINTVTSRLQLTDLSLQQIQSSVENFTELLPNDAYAPTSPTNTTGPSIQSQASLLLQQVAGLLNVQDGTRYLFGGTDSATAPVNLGNLPTVAPSLATPVNGPGGYYQGGANIPPAQIGQQVSLNYGITANDASTFEPIMRVLNFIANTPSFSSSNPTDVANLNQAASMLDGAVAGLTTMQGNLGLQESQLNNQQTLDNNTIGVDQTDISNIVQVNQAQAITQLNDLDTQLQASYAATSEIQKLSLVNFMGGSTG
jgi:flagellar hook-associated protein 3 FlgL